MTSVANVVEPGVGARFEAVAQLVQSAVCAITVVISMPTRCRNSGNTVTASMPNPVARRRSQRCRWWRP